MSITAVIAATMGFLLSQPAAMQQQAEPSRHTLYRLDQLPAPSASSSAPSFDTPAPLYRLTRYALPLRLNALPDLTLTGTAAPSD